ncbi:MAG: type II toxin-antitoxin system Phd/YefM family antitoxin [Anaerolineales bacterium]|nr:MAG: type II toxin-antitoxin system Phd/YefM family antitoxin [Anaerolineales bacterium]
MAKTVSLKEAQATYSLSLDKTDLAQGPIILEHEGEPVAAIIGIEDYRRLVAGQDDDTWRQEQLQRLQPEREAFQRLLPELLKTHKGQFVAIHKGKMVDADTDNRELAKRIYARKLFPVYIQLVSEKPRVIELPSPEEVRRVPL